MGDTPTSTAVGAELQAQAALNNFLFTLGFWRGDDPDL